MRISRLELFGFKSFCDRTRFTFGEGISCVVGPNGSGKSNVVDALKWVIGEQSARSLRGAEMQDVIFAGSVDRKPVGYAEVQLTLCTDEGEPFPGEYGALREVQVGRRLHRSGASEYLINQVKVRRRDVVDLFLDTGIGTNLYSFIEQGRVDKVVSATPHERRGLIDEAAGISRYKQRRAEARSRLESTVQQLDRAADVADEMARRLAVLERQVLKAARFRRLRARVRQRETFLALVKYRGLSADRRALQGALREGRREEAAARRGLLRREEDLRLRREEATSVEEAAATWRDEVAEHDAQLREAASQKTLQGQRAEELREQGAAAGQEAAAATTEAEELAAELVTVRQALAETERLLALRGANADERAEELARATAKREAAEAAAAAARVALSEAQAGAAGVAARLGELQRVMDARAGEDVAAQQAREGMAQRRRDLDAATRSAEDLLAGAGAELEHTDEVVRQAQGALAAAEAREAEAMTQHEARVSEAMALAAEARRAVGAAEAAVAQARREDAGARRVAGERRRRRRDQAVAGARQRGEQWVGAVERQARARLERLAAQHDAAVAAVEQEAAAAEEVARASARERQAERLEAIEHQIRDVLRPLRQQATRARRAVEDARARRTDAQLRVAEWAAKAVSLEARLADSDDELSLAPSLVDTLSPDEALQALARLGRRASLPMYRSASAVAEVLASLPDDREVELWLEGPWPDAPHEVATLTEAWAHVEATGTAAVVRGGTARVEADGVVHLAKGEPARSAEVRLRWRAALDEAREVLEQAEREVSDATEEEERAEAAVQAAEQALADAEREAEQARRQARREAEEEAADTVSRAVEAGRSARDEAAAARTEALRAVRVRSDQVAVVVRERRDVELERLVTVFDASLSAAQDRDAAELAVQESAWSATLAEASTRLDEALQAVEDVRAQRPRPADDVGPRREELAAARETRDAARQARAVAERATALQAERRHGWDADQRRLEADDLRRAELRARQDAQRESLEQASARFADQVTACEMERASAEAAAKAAAEVEQLAARAHATAEGEGGALRERQVAQQTRAADLDRRRGAAAERAHQQEERAGQLLARAGEAAAAAEEASRRHDTVTEARAVSFDRLQRERARGDELKRGLAEAEGDLAQLQERHRDATAHVQKLTEQSAAVRAEIDAVRTRLDDRYQVSLPGLLDRLERAGRLDLVADAEVARGMEVGRSSVEGVAPWVVRPPMLESEDDVRGALEELEQDRAALGRLGEVHLGAMEEYEELATRHSELASQREDLEASVQRLRAAIAKMNRTCRERFREAFDRVNENFQVSYPQLLGGGSARLALTDDEDLLETGVEIFVQPPGKRLQSLSLLSGGEKAMTAIALLIALFRVRPSPFCVLDEVDAPLDERNGGRFNGMLRELARTSQFVVITHNRKTMECADTLYGVSMTRPGVSSLVSVALG